MIELWGMQSTPSLPLLPGPLCPDIVAPDRILSIGQIELFDYLNKWPMLNFLLVGRMNQNMNLKEKWVYEEKFISYKNGYKSYIILYMQTEFDIE